MEIKRDLYLDKLIERRENRSIKVITGIRRCGKSYLLFHLYYNYLLQSGVPANHIIRIALDDDEHEDLLDRKALGAYIRAQLQDDGMYYIFLDEIQFVEGFEKLREEYYPGNWSYKHDRHSASVLLAVNNPESNYVYKSNNALKMAEYLDFGLRIGSGQTFSLQNYYKMCDGIVEALYQHDSLLEKHFNYLNDTHYHDKSLHLLAFDLIYCSYCYNYYRGLVSFATGRTISKKTVQRVELSLEELERAEKEKQLKISELEKQIADAEKRCDEFEDISLIGVQVTAPKYGIGTVISQDVNKVTVCFNNTEKTFILDERFSARPRFENDEEIVHAFSQLARDKEELQILRKQLTDLL